MSSYRLAWLAAFSAGGAMIMAAACSSDDTTAAPAKQAVCGDGIVDVGEDCDDGNTDDTDECLTSCEAASCGDGEVGPGEDCDDGNDDEDDACLNDCSDNPDFGQGGGGAGGGDGGTGGTGGEGGTVDACEGLVLYEGLAKNDAGSEDIPAQWAFTGADPGTAAGNAMCAAIGADHVCEYNEVVMARDRGELDGIAADTTIWVHRTEAVVVDGTTYQAGAGARCKDWTYGSSHQANGEFGTFTGVGAINFTLDLVPCADEAGCVQPTLPCGTTTLRKVLCCNDLPEECLVAEEEGE